MNTLTPPPSAMASRRTASRYSTPTTWILSFVTTLALLPVLDQVRGMGSTIATVFLGLLIANSLGHAVRMPRRDRADQQLVDLSRVLFPIVLAMFGISITESAITRGAGLFSVGSGIVIGAAPILAGLVALMTSEDEPSGRCSWLILLSWVVAGWLMASIWFFITTRDGLRVHGLHLGSMEITVIALRIGYGALCVLSVILAIGATRHLYEAAKSAWDSRRHV